MAANTNPSYGGDPQPGGSRKRTSTMGSMANSVRSVTQTMEHATTEILHSNPPPGFFAATAEVASHAPTIGEIRRGSYGEDGWQRDPQMERRRRTLSQGRRASLRRSGASQERLDEGQRGLQPFPALAEVPSQVDREDHAQGAAEGSRHLAVEAVEDDIASEKTASDTGSPALLKASERTDHDRIRPLSKDHKVYSSGYIPPPKIPWTTSTWIGLKAFWKWFLTPFGFCVTIYGLNVVAWGGMLFLLLCNASPAMCWAPIPNDETVKHMSPAASLALNSKYPRYKNCNDINSPRRVWLEIDSQILNALFCVTGFGLIPWRFRDWYYLLLWRCTSEKRSGREKKMYGLRTLAGFYSSWVRLPGSQTQDQITGLECERAAQDLPTIDVEAAYAFASDLRQPLPLSRTPAEPLTGVRAPPTALWKIDFFVWSQVLNTFLQACLCGAMWGLNRYNRPSWVTGLLIGLACVIAGAGGVVSYIEGGKVKRVEGVRAQQPPGNEDLELQQTRTGHESLHLDEGGKGKA